MNSQRMGLEHTGGRFWREFKPRFPRTVVAKKVAWIIEVEEEGGSGEMLLPPEDLVASFVKNRK